jgi:hypothetical protein
MVLPEMLRAGADTVIAGGVLLMTKSALLLQPVALLVMTSLYVSGPRDKMEDTEDPSAVVVPAPWYH